MPNNFLLYTYHSFYIHQSVDRQTWVISGYFYTLAIVANVEVSMAVPFQDKSLIYLGCTLTNRLSELYSNSIFVLGVEELQTMM